MEVNLESVVMPGNILSANIIDNIDKKYKVIVGPGLRRCGNQIAVCKAGILRGKLPNTFWVDNYQKRYVPARGEAVVGVVTSRGGDTLKVDIGASEQASLSFFAFEGASKKNKRDINIGDVIYGRLSIASCDMEPELVCIDSNYKQGKYGVLQDGFLFSCSLSLIYKILNPKCSLIKLLGKELKFEIVAGLNGKVWVKANNIEDTIAVANALLWAEFKTDAEMRDVGDNIMNFLKRFQQRGG